MARWVVVVAAGMGFSKNERQRFLRTFGWIMHFEYMKGWWCEEGGLDQAEVPRLYIPGMLTRATSPIAVHLLVQACNGLIPHTW